MSQTRLVDLARLNIESSIAGQDDFDSVIRNYANKNYQKIAYIIVKWFFFLIFS